MGHVAKAEGNAYAVEGGIRKWQCLGVTANDRHEASGVGQPVSTRRKHRPVDVGQPDPAFRADPVEQQTGHVAGATGDVQYPVAGANPRGIDGKSLPEPMQADRHEVVHHVVAGRNRIEYTTDPTRLVARVDLGETKVGLTHRKVGD